MNVLLLSFLVAASPLDAEGAPLFERPEPHLQRGARLLQQGDADGALEAFRRAAAKTADERAVVEYDVAQALELKARDLAQAQQKAQAPAAEGAPPAEPNPEDAAALKAALNDAKDTYVRAAELARDRRLRSEAHLAAGNTSAVQGELDDAIASYRKSLVTDPTNERAKHNLLRVLLAKKQQPPPPEPEPQEGGDEKNDEDGEEKNDEQKDGEQDGQQESEPKDGEQDEGKEGKDGEQKDGEPEQKDGAGDRDKNDPNDKKDDDKDAQESPSDGKNGEQKDGNKKPAGGAAGDKKQSAKDAQRLLEALRAREKPLGPLEMKDLKPARPLHGKDW